MRKTFLILSATLLVAMMLVACSSDQTRYPNVLVNLKTLDGAKALTSSLVEFNVDDYYWRYTAVNTVSSRTGEKTTETKVKSSGTGLGALEDVFATGDWTFCLFGYTDQEFTNRAFYGSADVSFDGTNPVETVTVSVGPLTTDKGTLKIEALSPETALTVATAQSVSILKLGETEPTTCTGPFPQTVELASGVYNVTVTVSYTAQSGSEYKTAEEDIQVAIYDNLQTTISGTVSDITSHVILNADGPFLVNFDTKGGSSIASQLIVKGGFATKPSTDPTKPGYAFLGWKADADGTTPFDFANTAITKNTTVYAQWAKIPTQITIKVKNGNTNLNVSRVVPESFSTSWELTGLAKPAVTYVGRGNTTYGPLTSKPTAAGTYTATMTVGGKSVSYDFEIKEAN